MEASTREQTLLTEYGEAASTFRSLTEIRFKLLAFLPLGAGAAAVLFDDRDAVDTLALCIFGLVVTAALVTYNTRNDQLYDELVGRLASIEREVGLPAGAFASRPVPWLRFGGERLTWEVNHRHPIDLIYTASLGLWLYGVLASIGRLLRRAYIEGGGPDYGGDAESLLRLAALALTLGLVWLARRRMRARTDALKGRLRTNAANAVRLAVPVLTGLATKETDPTDADVEADPARVSFLAACVRLSGEGEATLNARLRFFYDHPEHTPLYVGEGTELVRAAQLTACVTDFSPRWLHDVATGRRGAIGTPA